MVRNSYAYFALAALIGAVGIGGAPAKADDVKMGYINKMGELSLIHI